jgi:ATP-dependent Clp protease ATP-binding subunit ClpA
MINIRSGHDLWQAYSTTLDEEPSTRTLTEFLVENAGKRCVVVLDEIEKIGDDKALWSLHMPWETGRVLLETGRPHVDVRNVIWLATSNIGDTLVFEHNAERPDPTAPTTRGEYVELMRRLRPKVSDRLGAPLLSRVTAVLPFVPFTEDEKLAIAAEALFALGGNRVSSMAPAVVSSVAARALESYLPEEGARSLYRAVSSLLMDEL